ncbi:hypothetical protein [Leekyejoonella antrihumi]|uniref:Uncharacterized protein n=1 Tax=Leekyejoonella antrihumi TaxID=1660198 RepID=A0A563E805_9MICO|nr:hypothetical protein [Leekyejoonella antrihumi]TWP38666.1 hypothetical protein FGL98_02465 [Leekyejoonella antrihumi]
MNATIKVDCARCGAVELPMADAQLVPFGPRGSTVVEFTCPVCAHLGRKELTERATLLLMHAGVGLTTASADGILDPDDSSSGEHR